MTFDELMGKLNNKSMQYSTLDGIVIVNEKGEPIQTIVFEIEDGRIMIK